jgi:hypothetical protein
MNFYLSNPYKIRSQPRIDYMLPSSISLTITMAREAGEGYEGTCGARNWLQSRDRS